MFCWVLNTPPETNETRRKMLKLKPWLNTLQLKYFIFINSFKWLGLLFQEQRDALFLSLSLCLSLSLSLSLCLSLSVSLSLSLSLSRAPSLPPSMQLCFSGEEDKKIPKKRYYSYIIRDYSFYKGLWWFQAWWSSTHHPPPTTCEWFGNKKIEL